ncbi:MAG: hypothetical protein R8M46_05430 [Ghiorsea sp.]
MNMKVFKDIRLACEITLKKVVVGVETRRPSSQVIWVKNQMIWDGESMPRFRKGEKNEYI